MLLASFATPRASVVCFWYSSHSRSSSISVASQRNTITCRDSDKNAYLAEVAKNCFQGVYYSIPIVLYTFLILSL
jgi:hypothetical protein